VIGPESHRKSCAHANFDIGRLDGIRKILNTTRWKLGFWNWQIRSHHAARHGAGAGDTAPKCRYRHTNGLVRHRAAIFNVVARSASAVQTRTARGHLKSLDGPICQGAVERPQVGDVPTWRGLRVSENDWRLQLWPFLRPLSGEYLISPSGADTTAPAKLES